MDAPEIQYVAVGDADVAYQVIGEGPINVLYCYGLGSHLELLWDMAPTREVLLRLASFCRLTMFDRRGTGASDRVARNAPPTWEEWAEDIGAVLDAIGAESAAILASLDAGSIALMYAAMHPERVTALALVNTTARYMIDDDYPIGFTEAEVDSIVDMVRESWGTRAIAELTNPSVRDDTALMEQVARTLRAAATPRSAAAQYDYILRHDVRAALPAVQAPALVLNVRDTPLMRVEQGRWLAEHLTDARFKEIPGGDLGLGPYMLEVADEIAEFLTGARPMVDVERVLTTVMYTDIVRSTETAAALGDHRWKQLLDTHDRTVREQLRRFRGNEINTTGDGFVASFDGPARAVRCARAIQEATTRLGIDVRAGLHTGECEVRGDDLGGLAMHIAARVAGLAQSGDVMVSSTIRDLVVGSGLEFLDRGEHELKGVPGNWRLFAVAG